jgi:Ulp1 family protease
MPNVFAFWKAYHKQRNTVFPRAEWKSKRILAFPVHIADPGHWTLSIAVNTNWATPLSIRPHVDVYHLDSLPDNPQHRKLSESFARHIFQLEDTDYCQVHEVAVPRQPHFSNDCGLYPAHFMKIFLTDVEKGLLACINVSASILLCYLLIPL